MACASQLVPSATRPLFTTVFRPLERVVDSRRERRFQIWRQKHVAQLRAAILNGPKMYLFSSKPKAINSDGSLPNFRKPQMLTPLLRSATSATMRARRKRYTKTRSKSRSTPHLRTLDSSSDELTPDVDEGFASHESKPNSDGLAKPRTRLPRRRPPAAQNRRNPLSVGDVIKGMVADVIEHSLLEVQQEEEHLSYLCKKIL